MSPIYEYRCPSCSHVHERVRPIRFAEDGATCPECEGWAERVPSVTGIAWVRGGTPVHHRGSIRELDGRGR